MTDLTNEMRDFLHGVHFAVVATLRPDGMPHQTVMWYALEDESTVLLNTPFDSLKHCHLKRDPRLSVCIEDGYQYITLRGTVEINEDPQEAAQDYMKLGQRYRDSFPARPPQADGERPAILNRERVTLRLKINSMVSNGL